MVVAGGLALTGCSGSAPSAMTTPSPSVPSTVATTSHDTTHATLSSRGFEHGPADFPLPAGLDITYSVDNPNNVTVVIDPAQGEATYRFLRTHLAAAGFTVTADANSSLVFSGHGWTGAYTASAETAALTLRTGPVG